MRKASRKAGLVGVLAVAASLLMILPASAVVISLPGSTFEIDSDANLVVDVVGNDDWASIPQGTGTGQERRKADEPTGSNDDSFGQGSKEDTAVPSVVDGSIPPNKSDLEFFGAYLEENADGKFLNIYWTRVQDPSGTTNMDFEFNKSEIISSNGVTPIRTAGDVLIQYDLSQGGTNPQLFLSRWVTSGPGSQCVANNSTPCWGNTTDSGLPPRENLTAAGDATGSINTTLITEANADGLGQLDPRTFGEAQIDFAAFAGEEGECVGFGSAYLKSRSSDSFTAALKDFIAPLPLAFNECGSLKITKTAKHAAAESGTINQSGVTFTIDGPATGTDDAFDVVTGDDGTVCVDDLVGGSYSVTESVPTGYAADGLLTKTATVTEGTTCADDPYTGGAVSFSNTPLTDLSVTVTSQIAGGTDSQISCVNDAAPLVVIASHDTDATGTGTASVEDLLPGEYTCTVTIDP